MIPLTVFGAAALLLALKKGVDVFVNADRPASRHRPTINAVLQIGIFSFFFGILGQALGLLEALQVIEQLGPISPSLVAGGVKVSMITTVYGLLIFLVSFVAWAVLKYRNETLED
jgi:biopolymer transport protein ExbB/TolQ